MSLHSSKESIMYRIAPVLLALLAASSLLSLAAEPAAPLTVTGAVVKGNTQFGLELFGQLRQQEGNLFYSPYSISTALAMTYAGARGETAAEMAKTLHFALPQEQLHPAFGQIVKQINGDGSKRGYQLSTANALWGQKGYPFLPDFLSLTRTNYGAGLKEVDFANATEQARQTINAWVEKETQDKIKELLKVGILTPDTRLVLTNAIYFKGSWASQFKKDQTRPEPFFQSAQNKIQAPLMHQTHAYGYLDAGTFQILEMPYVGKELSMVVLLPKKLDGLADLEKSLTADRLDDWLKRLHTEDVIVTLPKFKTTGEFSLADALKSLGMKQAFDENTANFKGLNGGKEPLFISAVVHKAFVDVNEEGTEAAAATGVIIARPTAVIDPKPTPVFRADHPFVFLIRDRTSGSILFLGRLADPTR
jgi:serpin B